MKKYVVRVSFGRYSEVVRECATEAEAQLVLDVVWRVLRLLKLVPISAGWLCEFSEDAAAAPEVE